MSDIPKNVKSGVHSFNLPKSEDSELLEDIYSERDKFLDKFKFKRPQWASQSNNSKSPYDSQLAGDGLCAIVKCKHVFHNK